MTLNEAEALLPKDAKWSCSFGCPGVGGFVEYHRTTDGTRWIIFNHPDDAADWQCETVQS
jgi:hypothetical protein